METPGQEETSGYKEKPLQGEDQAYQAPPRKSGQGEGRGEDITGRKAIVQALSAVQKIVPVRPLDILLKERITLRCVSCVLSPILQKDNLRLRETYWEVPS